MMKKQLTTLALASLFTGSAFAGDALFAPAKSKGLRDLSADRPDATESPMTVDKGHWQIETSIVDFSRNDVAGVRTEALTWMETNLKYGIADNMDLQFVFAPYIEERVSTGGNLTSKTEGASDVEVRLKWNLYGNDEGKTALALMPYVKIPTGTPHSNNKVEGGLIIPWSMEVSENFGIGLQVEFMANYVEAKDSHDIDVSHTVVAGYSLTEKWGVYGEYVGVFAGDDYDSYLSAGITYAVHSNFQLDLGAVVGLNDEADDFNCFTGFTVKY